MSTPISGVRPATFENLQLDAGVFFKRLDYSAAEDAEALYELIADAIEAGTDLLGATRGGGTFECTPEVREIEADGKRYAFKGSTVFDSWTVKMTGTLLEVTPDNLKTILSTGEISGTGAKKTVKVRTGIQNTDYLDKLVWAGNTSKGYVLIALENALNTTGASMTFSDKGEGTLPFEFVAHQSNVANVAYAPCEIIFFEVASE